MLPNTCRRHSYKLIFIKIIQIDMLPNTKFIVIVIKITIIISREVVA